MHLRPGHTNRIYDGDRFTVAMGGGYVGNGSHCRPRVDIIDRHRNYRRVSLPLPLVRFRRCYRLRHIGGLRWYRLWHRLMRRLCVAPRRPAPDLPDPADATLCTVHEPGACYVGCPDAYTWEEAAR